MSKNQKQSAEKPKTEDTSKVFEDDVATLYEEGLISINGKSVDVSQSPPPQWRTFVPFLHIAGTPALVFRLLEEENKMHLAWEDFMNANNAYVSIDRDFDRLSIDSRSIGLEQVLPWGEVQGLQDFSCGRVQSRINEFKRVYIRVQKLLQTLTNALAKNGIVLPGVIISQESQRDELPKRNTRVMELIKEELRHEALLGRELEERLANKHGIDRDARSIKRALTSLKEQGIVANKRGLGYYLIS
ncbi:MAG: hypothetical protein WC655_27345 [Candidatus Hydrogenedentales bacterium]|jgi:hypothetical protein